jgi:hypothetical protein
MTGNVTNGASARVIGVASTASLPHPPVSRRRGYEAGVVSAGALRRRMRTASMRFSRTDSTRIE